MSRCIFLKGSTLFRTCIDVMGIIGIITYLSGIHLNFKGVSGRFLPHIQSFGTYEPQRKGTYLWTCALDEDSDQPVHSRILIRIFVYHMLDSQGCKVSSCE